MGVENSRTPSPSQPGRSTRGEATARSRGVPTCPSARLDEAKSTAPSSWKAPFEWLPPVAEQTSSSIVVDAPPAAVMDVIADFPAYPEWAKGVKEATVRAEGAGGRADEVYFALDVAPIKDEYTLAYTWNGDRDVSWTLAEGKMLRALDGAYVLRDLGGGSTEVTYRLALDVSIPLIGMIKRKGEKILIDTALKGLKQRVESLAR